MSQSPKSMRDAAGMPDPSKRYRYDWDWPTWRERLLLNLAWVLTAGGLLVGAVLANRSGIAAYAALGFVWFALLNAIGASVRSLDRYGENRRSFLASIVFGLISAAFLVVAGVLRQ